MDIILAVILGYILRLFSDRYLSKYSIPDICKNCKYPKDCKKNLGRCKHFIPKENLNND